MNKTLYIVFSLLDRKGLLYSCFFSLFCLFPLSVLTLYSASFNPCSLLSLYSTSFHPFSLPILTRHSTCFLSLFCFVPPVPPVLPRSTHLFSIFCLFPLFSLTILPIPPRFRSLFCFFLPISSPYIFCYTSSWFHSLIQLLLYFLYFFSHSICLELYQKRLFSLFYHISLPVFPPLFCFFSISFTFCPILFAWKFTRNCFFHFFTLSHSPCAFPFLFFSFRRLELYQKPFFSTL